MTAGKPPAKFPPMKAPRFVLLTAIVMVAIMLAGCSREEPPVARLEVRPFSVVLRHGQCSAMQFRWSMLRDLEKSDGTPRVFVHMLDGSGKLARTFDHPIRWQWKSGTTHEYAIDVCQSATAPALAAGVYDVKVGIYDDRAGSRWPLETNGEQRGNRSYLLAQISVPAEGGRLPLLQFGSGWGPAEEAGDKQVLVRRPFSASAPISVRQISEKGSFLLTLRAEDPSAKISVSSSCGTVSNPVISGSGAHDLRIEAVAPASACEIFLNLTGGRRATLERIGWTPRA